MTERVRIFAAAGLVAVLALGGGFMLLGRGQSSPSAAVKEIKPLHPVRHHPAAKPAKPAKPAQKKPLAAKPKAAPKPKRTPAVIDGMPAALALALRADTVAVVALYAPGSSVDELARAEAEAGAKDAGVAFVSLDVSNERVAAPLTSLLTGGASAADRVLDDPAVLVFTRPKTLYVRLSGWNDRDTVAQAVENALNGT
ncbi:MAG: hypothetical protein E6G15_08170 [Actinobacteria bacterium]|nr:MAG: hypothetical protein E6G15_08170 [Actinomycetota bacterium]